MSVGKKIATIVDEHVRGYADPAFEAIARRFVEGDAAMRKEIAAAVAAIPAAEKGDRGEAGPAGDRGAAGADGAAGARGEKGDVGEAGAPGEPGPRGDKGDPGERGEKGEQGDRGEQGSAGERGADGAAGLNGADGARGEKGEKGDPGDRGADAVIDTASLEAMCMPVVEAALAKMLPALIEKAVAAQYAQHPPAPGRDGRDGLPGNNGMKGADGADGADGKDGAPGRDGLGFDHLDVEHDGERTVTLRFVAGDREKKFPIVLPVPIDRGVFKAAETYSRGDAVSWGGSQFIAQRATSAKPETDDSWRLAVKRGRDGKDGAAGKDYAPPKPVKVG